MTGAVAWPVVIVCTLMVVAGAYLLPFRLFPPKLVDPHRTLLSGADRVQAMNGLRSVMIQALVGAALLLGLWYTAHTARIAQRTFDLSRQAQAADQFTRAVDQLGQTGFDKTDVRASGAYSLGMLAEQRSEHGSGRLRTTIFRVLESFLLQHDSLAFRAPLMQNRGTPGGPVLDSDFQAVLRVMTEHRPLPGDDPLQLASLELGGADLRNAHLEGANLALSNLESADLRGAHLHGADLRGACLQFARFEVAALRTATTDPTTITNESDQTCGRAAGDRPNTSVSLVP